MFQSVTYFRLSWSYSLKHVQMAVKQHPQVLFHGAAFQPFFPQPEALPGLVGEVQDAAFCLAEPHTMGLSLLVLPLWTPLKSLPSLHQISTLTQLNVLCQITEGELDSIVSVIAEEIKQNWLQH